MNEPTREGNDRPAAPRLEPGFTIRLTPMATRVRIELIAPDGERVYLATSEKDPGVPDEPTTVASLEEIVSVALRDRVERMLDAYGRRSVSLLTEKYVAPPSCFAAGTAERWRGGDGYDVMAAATADGWQEIPLWGREGWDLGVWPYVIIFVRHTPEGYELVHWIEGDVRAFRYATVAERNRAIDELAFGHWKAEEQPWVRGIRDHGSMPERLRGPYLGA